MTNVGYVGSTERHHLLSGCKKLAGTEYIKRHNNTLKVLAVKWATENCLQSGIQRNGNVEK